jgi:AcrR family transcriptional regulator
VNTLVLNTVWFYHPTMVSPKGSVGVGSARRRYHSPLRAQRAADTRAALLAAASRLFTTKGWTATGMRDVAEAAGVATETLYKHFSSKRGLLQAVIDVAVVGDDLPLAVADRPEFVALGRGPRRDRFVAAAALVAGIHRRTASYAALLREAAAVDEDMADLLRTTRERQRRDVEAGVQLVIGREPTRRQRDSIWALVSPDVYLLLVVESGWSDDEYETWLAETLERLVPNRDGRVQQ